ncbi:hypothetical protein [Frankia sp. Cj3]|uniref:hypothetical protein n=1 Tax=Frankia sp. Cj3 TaxID=2880976 RepID=UPI001EF61618|nr:hypothetical protein [Frankia sp. Cj3]
MACASPWAGDRETDPVDEGSAVFGGVREGVASGDGMVDGVRTGVAVGGALGLAGAAVANSAQGWADGADDATCVLAAVADPAWHGTPVATAAGEAAAGEPAAAGDVDGSAAFGAGGSTLTCCVAYFGADFACWTFWIRMPCTLFRRFRVTTFRLVVMLESPSNTKRSLSGR